MTQKEYAYTDDPPIRVSNEFADIWIRKVHTRNGERLEIEAHRRGYRILLDAVELESLTWQTSDTFSAFLRGSVGPDEESGEPAPVVTEAPDTTA